MCMCVYILCTINIGQTSSTNQNSRTSIVDMKHIQSYTTNFHALVQLIGGRDEAISILSVGSAITSTSAVRYLSLHKKLQRYCRRFIVGERSCGKMVYSSAFGFHSTKVKSIMYIIYCSNNYNVLSMYIIQLLCNTKLCVGTLIMATSSAINKR